MRIKGLDFLRGIAIILVLFRHGEKLNILQHIGWLGVDLFFVLSGFLIAGLLFGEYRQTQKINVSNFLIKRGLKIYPSFYFFILSMIAFKYFVHHSFYARGTLISELLYLQSYFPATQGHTWTLAVEEHFYFGFAFLMYWATTKKILDNKMLTISCLLSIFVLCFANRFYLCYYHRKVEFFSFVATHLRCDGIIFDVLVAYLYHFTNFYILFLKQIYYFYFVAIICFLPAFYFTGGGFFMNTFGISSVSFSFSILVLGSLRFGIDNARHQYKIVQIPFNFLCFIGLHSYSIYLWHLCCKEIIQLLGFADTISYVLYFIFSISIGLIFSYLIEQKFRFYLQKRII